MSERLRHSSVIAVPNHLLRADLQVSSSEKKTDLGSLRGETLASGKEERWGAAELPTEIRSMKVVQSLVSQRCCGERRAWAGLTALSLRAPQLLVESGNRRPAAQREQNKVFHANTSNQSGGATATPRRISGC